MLKMKHVSLISALSFATVMFVGCGDDSGSSAPVEESENVSSSSSAILQSSSSLKIKSSDSQSKGSSSSSAKNVDSHSNKSSSSSEVKSSSSGNSDESHGSSSSDNLKSELDAKIKPSGTYDCSKYSCITTKYLNQEFLKSGKYGEILDERDNQVYKTIQIKDQVWLAQNLNLRYTQATAELDSSSFCYDN